MQIVFFVCLTPISAQEACSSPLLIHHIQFKGLKKTKAGFIKNNLLSCKEGKSAGLKFVKNDIQALKNFCGIYDATFKLDTLQEGLVLTFTIEESLTMLPIFNFGGVKGNTWFRIGGSDANWAGRGIQLSTFYQNTDGRSNYNLYMRLPYIRGTKWGTSLSLLKYASIEPLYFTEGKVNYRYDNFSSAATVFYNFQATHYLESGFSYFIENYKKTNKQELENPPGPEALTLPKGLFKLFHHFDRLNYDHFYVEGFQNEASLQIVSSLDGSKDWFRIFLNDTRYFGRVGEKGNLAARFRFGVSTNNDSPFAPFVLDSHVSIRGSGNRVDRGTAALILNLEYRHTVFDKEAFAAQIVGFSDTGSWRHPGGKLSDLIRVDHAQFFMGAGIRLIYKKAFGTTFRADYGIDYVSGKRRGFVLGFGQYF